jgi:hypothetical protein
MRQGTIIPREDAFTWHPGTPETAWRIGCCVTEWEWGGGVGEAQGEAEGTECKGFHSLKIQTEGIKWRVSGSAFVCDLQRANLNSE